MNTSSVFKIDEGRDFYAAILLVRSLVSFVLLLQAGSFAAANLDDPAIIDS